MGRYRPVAAGSGFQVGVWRCDECEPGPHEAEQATAFALVFPVAGAFVREQNGVRAFVDCTRVLLENAGEWYHVTHPVAGGDECTVLTLSERLTEALVCESTVKRNGTVFSRQTVRASMLLYAMHRRLAAYSEMGVRDPIEFDELTFDLMRHAMRATASDASPQPYSDRARHQEKAVDRVLELMHASFREPLSLEEIARHAGYSPFHLSRVFRERTGVPLHQYLTRLRLCACYEVVMDGEPDLTRVALAHGFSSHSHFSSAFHRAFGATPSAVRSPPLLPVI